MTPLKYRAFNHRTDEYIPVRTMMFGESGQPIAISSGGLDAKRIPIKDVTLERWTGHLDRAGHEIWEGDIIQRYINPAHGYYYLADRIVVEWRETGTYTGWASRSARRIGLR